MKAQVKLHLKYAWILCSLAILITSRALQIEPSESERHAATDWIGICMSLLNFPTGLPLYAVVNGVFGINDSVITWFVLSAGGYIQWFWLVPKMFAKREIITLFPNDVAEPKATTQLQWSKEIKHYSIRAIAALFTFFIGTGCASILLTHTTIQEQKAKIETAVEPIIPADAFITLERTRCYGTCPSYTLAITADGTTVFSGFYLASVNGISQWKRSGVIKSRISQHQLWQLINEFEKADYFSLQNFYRDSLDGCPSYATDRSSAYTSIQINGRKKSIEHYLGCLYSRHDLATYPPKLTTLENRIDEIVDTQQWMNDAIISTR